MGPERMNAAPNYEVEHFDDLEAADLALRGIKRVMLKDNLRSELRSISEKTNTLDNTQESEQDFQKTQLDGADDEDFGATEDQGPKSAEGDGLDFVNYDDEDEDEDYEDYDYWEDDYGPERAEELEREQKFELFTVPEELLEEYGIPKDLPQGVCVMGGTARSLARRMISGDREPVRDLDLVHITELSSPDQPLSKEELDEVSKKYMPDDFTYGHGIQTERIEDYFGSRDLTINQCLLSGNRLLMTRAAYDDFQENIIRPTYYEKRYEDDICHDRLLMRSLLLQTVLRESTESYPTLEEFTIYDDDDENYFEEEEEDDDRDETITYLVDNFEQVVTLNKAMSRGVKTAQNFTKTLAEWGIINPKFVEQPMMLAKELNTRLRYPFVYRPLDSPMEDPLDDSLNDDRQNNYNSLAELEPGSANYYANDPAVRQAMREYDSQPTRAALATRQEPQGATYSLADYEWMNKVEH